MRSRLALSLSLLIICLQWSQAHSAAAQQATTATEPVRAIAPAAKSASRRSGFGRGDRILIHRLWRYAGASGWHRGTVRAFADR